MVTPCSSRCRRSRRTCRPASCPVDSRRRPATAWRPGVSAAPQRIAVVGASLAGLSTARALRAQGYTGEVVVVGNEIHRPYDRPPLSKDFLGSQPRPGGALAGGRGRRPRRHLASGCPRHRACGRTRRAGQPCCCPTTPRSRPTRSSSQREQRPAATCRASGFPGCTCCAPSTTPSRCARTCTRPSRPARPLRSSAAGSSVPRWPRRLASSAARSPSSFPTTCRCGARWARTRMPSPHCTPPTASSFVPTPRSWASASPTPAGSRYCSTVSTPSPRRPWCSASARRPPSGGSSIPDWN